MPALAVALISAVAVVTGTLPTAQPQLAMIDSNGTTRNITCAPAAADSRRPEMSRRFFAPEYMMSFIIH
jgi:hypothetical protein